MKLSYNKGERPTKFNLGIGELFYNMKDKIGYTVGKLGEIEHLFSNAQKWVDVTADRIVGEANVYTNDTGSPIVVSINVRSVLVASAINIDFFVDDVRVAHQRNDTVIVQAGTIIATVPVGSKYLVKNGTYGDSITWMELR